MLTRTDDKWVSSGFLLFKDMGKLIRGGKTHEWAVFNRKHLRLGEVKWLRHWRSYGFFPKPETAFDKTCLRDIAEFCEELTKAHIGKEPFLASVEMQVVEGSNAPKDTEE
jgi:hypothetical protein